MKRFFSAAVLLLSFCCPALEFSDADIVLPPKPSDYLKFTARELALHLKMITGGKFNITAAPKSKVKIMLGQLPGGFDRKKISERDSFAVVAKGNTLYIAGHDTYNTPGYNIYGMLVHQRGSRGTMSGVYTFLEEQGVRWLAPGEKNTYVYRKKSIKVPEGVRITVPAVKGRALAGIYNFGQSFHKKDAFEYYSPKKAYSGHLWALRNRYCRNRYSYAHSQSRLQLNRIWKKNPERFQMMKNGRRNNKYLCWTDPAVLEMWKKVADAYFAGKKPAQAGFPHLKNWNGLGLQETFCIDPMDHGASNDGRCYCKRCQAFRKKNPCPDDSEIMWQVIAKVAQMVKARYPGKYIGTLVYPPKQRIPKTVKLPGNIRVVICLQGPKKINDPKSMKHQLGTLRAWNKVVGKGNVGLWSYQCELHGGKLPGVPEYYPEYFQRYLKQILPYTNSIYHEHHAHNLTYRLLETYLHFKIFWDPDADVKKLKAEHIRLYYGPAAPFMAKVIARMEENWRRYERGSKNVPDPSSQIGIYRNFSSLKKFVWGKIYDKKEMAYLESLLKSAQKAAGKSIYGERVERFHRLVFKFMERERLEVMDLSDLAPRITITSAPWEKQKSYQLISAHRDGTKLDSSLRCMFRLHKGFLQVRVIADEPRIADIRVTPRLKNGSPMIWKDWALEFFLYVPSDKAIRQYIVNAANVLSRTTTSAMKRYWSNGAEAKSVITRKNDQIIWDLSIPLSELGKDLKGLKLNVAHERNLKKGSTGYATFSPAALLGNWHNTDAYAQVTIKK